ncbi:unnamed protein product [Gadus morhua 'NCC']
MERLPERDKPPTDTRERTHYQWSFPLITWGEGEGGGGGGGWVGGVHAHAIWILLLDGGERNVTFTALGAIHPRPVVMATPGARGDRARRSFLHPRRRRWQRRRRGRVAVFLPCPQGPP